MLTWSALHAYGATPAPSVPSSYQALDSSLNGYLSAFNTKLSSSSNGSKYPVLFSGTLTSADANAGPQLINSGYYTGVQLQLQAMKAIGIKAVMVEIGFPMLYAPFFSSQSQYQQLVSFYQQVAAGAHALGMKLIVENNCLLSNDAQAGWNTAPFYASLSWTEYQAARAQTAAVIAQTVRPDYLVVLEEPDTEAIMSGQTEANTVSGSTSMLSEILTSVRQAGVSGMKIGAGVGSWQNGYLGYIQNFVAQPLDFIDMHIYPVNNTGSQNFLTNALTIASTAAAAGKPMAMTECWLNKVANNEFGVLTADQIRARNVYSFWEPLDASFFQTMESLASYTQMIFLAPSNSEYYWAYQTYNSSLDSASPGSVLNTEATLVGQALQQASFTSTAQSYHDAIVSPSDTIPPSTPANLTGGSSSPSTAAISWISSADNVGVAGYAVLRNGVNIATTAHTQFQDSGLAGPTTYGYVVKAFDLSGNMSSPSLPVNITTKDVVAPSAPSNLAATMVSTAQINLTWSASTDNSAIGSYRVFRGTSVAGMIQVATTSGAATSFSSYSLNPATTYYFAVEAVDTSGNVSPMSQIKSAATAAPPSVPTKVSATAPTKVEVSLTWAVAQSTLPLSSYRIYRGSSASNLTQLAVTSATKTSFTDYPVTAGTKYYYAVQAVGSAGSLSPVSAAVEVTTPH